MKHQNQLFDLIRSVSPPHVKLANAVSELLNISPTAAYDRMSGRVALRLDEACALCQRYGISLDAAMSHDGGHVPFQYVPLSEEGPDRYLRYIKGLEAAMEQLAAGSEKELLFAADDIPIFHFMPYPELTYFKLYAWNRTMNDTEVNYERFVRSIDSLELRAIFRNITNAYLQVPSAEIWTEETIDPILRLLAHYRDLDGFDHAHTLQKLYGQLMDLIGQLEKWAAASRKGADPGTAYDIYLCPVKPGSSMMLTRCDGKQSVRLKLYTINSIATGDDRLCSETAKWLGQTISKSTNMSRAAEVRRTRFFKSMKTKVLAMTA